MTPRKAATIGILFGIFLSAMDSTLVITALPTIVSEFRHVELYFLPISIAMIVQTVSMPIFGRLSDLYGRKRFHMLGILLFTAGSILCSFAESMTALVVFRSIQVIGSGALMPLSFTMIADLYPLEQRAKMQGAISGVWGLAALIGPPLGGFVTNRFGWQNVFLVTLPLGLVSLYIIQKVWRDVDRPARKARPDIAGAGLLTLASGALLTGFSLIRQPGVEWTSTPVMGLFSLAAILFAGLVLVERRSKDPFLAVDLFRIRLFWTGTLCSALMGVCMFCALAYLPLFVQAVIGGSPMMAGMVLTPMMLAWVSCSAAGGYLLLRFGYRQLAMAGTLLAMVGYFFLGRMDAGSSWFEAACAVMALGAGLGFVLTPLLISAQNAVSPARMGAATSLTQFSRSMAGALGVALAGAAMSTMLESQGIDADRIVNPELRKQLGPHVIGSMRSVMADSLKPVFTTGFVAAALAFLAALLLPAGRAADLRSAEAIRTPGSPRE